VVLLLMPQCPNSSRDHLPLPSPLLLLSLLLLLLVASCYNHAAPSSTCCCCCCHLDLHLLLLLLLLLLLFSTAVCASAAVARTLRACPQLSDYVQHTAGGLHWPAKAFDDQADNKEEGGGRDSISTAAVVVPLYGNTTLYCCVVWCYCWFCAPAALLLCARKE